VSENRLAGQQAGLVRRAETGCRNNVDLAGARSGGKFVASRAGEAYDARDRGPNWKFRTNISPPCSGDSSSQSASVGGPSEAFLKTVSKNKQEDQR
jgi:hypothetical protein